MDKITIVKTSGEKETFSEAKLRSSLRRVGAPPELVKLTVDYVMGVLKDGMTTTEIYHHAFNSLRKYKQLAASRYNLKKAMLSLGPTGYPFEKLVAAVLKAHGFSVETDQYIRGHCISHEVDVVAQKSTQHIIVECKYHNQPGYKTDAKVALYVKARFDDIKKRNREEDSNNNRLESWLVTNTKLSQDAIRYCECIGIKAIGWDYPKNDSLQNLIESKRLYPLTSLTSLTSIQKKQLLSHGAVMCRDLIENNNLLTSIGLREAKIIQVLRETTDLCIK